MFMEEYDRVYGKSVDSIPFYFFQSPRNQAPSLKTTNRWRAQNYEQSHLFHKLADFFFLLNIMDKCIKRPPFFIWAAFHLSTPAA